MLDIARLKTDVSASSATSQIAVTSPAVITATSTQPGTSPRSPICILRGRALGRANSITHCNWMVNLVSMSSPSLRTDDELQALKTWIDSDQHDRRQDEKDHWYQHRHLFAPRLLHQQSTMCRTNV